jgi:hypothetical protein
LIAQGFLDATGKEIGKAVQKVAGSAWRALGNDKKKYWNAQAILAWEKNGGREKARLEAKRLAGEAAESKNQEEGASRQGDTKKRKTRKKPFPDIDVMFRRMSACIIVLRKMNPTLNSLV